MAPQKRGFALLRLAVLAALFACRERPTQQARQAAAAPPATAPADISHGEAPVGSRSCSPAMRDGIHRPEEATTSQVTLTALFVADRASRFYGASPTRRSKLWKRGSLRRESKAGLTFSDVSPLECSA